MREVTLLRGDGKIVKYIKKEGNYEVEWKNTKFEISENEMNNIINCYFQDDNKWYPLGANVSNPTPGGLGEFVQNNIHLTPRHASAIAAILADENILLSKGKRPIYLKKVIKSKCYKKEIVPE